VHGGHDQAVVVRLADDLIGQAPRLQDEGALLAGPAPGGAEDLNGFLLPLVSGG
jgi:hypothetical protein